MIHVIEPLAKVPGVRVAMLVTNDGVPVTVRGKRASTDPDDRSAYEEDAESLAGLATNWFHELTRSGGLLSWNPPRRAVLHASRGTIVLLSAPAGTLLVLIDRGTSDEDLRLPMDGAVARMQRVLRSLGSEQAEPVGQREDLPAPLPQRQVHNTQHGERASRE